MNYSEESYLMLSGIQHFVFCRRQWALIHIEQQWRENFLTIQGKIIHENVHNREFHEKRGDVIYTRSMPVSSPSLGLSGECDMVELHRSPNGVPIFGYEGTYEVIPIEYKRGTPKKNDCDSMQLTAQAMCLEEMLCCNIPIGYLYYNSMKRRCVVEFTHALRNKVEMTAAEMHKLYEQKYIPKAKKTKSCEACSMNDVCLPSICGKKSASDYIKKMLDSMEL